MESIAEYRNSQKSENIASIENSSQLVKYRAQQFCRYVRKMLNYEVHSTNHHKTSNLLRAWVVKMSEHSLGPKLWEYGPYIPYEGYILCNSEQIPLKIIVHLFLIIPSKNLINHKYKLRQTKGLHPYQQCQFSLFFFLMHFVSFLGLDFPKKYSYYQITRTGNGFPGLRSLVSVSPVWRPRTGHFFLVILPVSS